MYFLGFKTSFLASIVFVRLKQPDIFHKGNNWRREIPKREHKKKIDSIYKKHDVPPMFWPDSVSVLYAGATLEAKNIDFVRDLRTTPLPDGLQLRPIERYYRKIVKHNLKKEEREKKIC